MPARLCLSLFLRRARAEWLSWKRLGKKELLMSEVELRAAMVRQDKAKWGQSSALSFGRDVNKEPVANLVGLYYGPYSSQGFESYLQRADGASGKPWLCVTLDFVDKRSLDLVFADEKQVTTWFCGLQACAPLSNAFISKGYLLWQRLIMKINFLTLRFFIQHTHTPKAYAAKLAANK
jgi:hypothetical protein